MGETTIGWTSTILPDGRRYPGYTFNPWIGCTKISTGCLNCYAERDNQRFNWVQGWGPGAPRRHTSAKNWTAPLNWAAEAAKLGIVRRIFCASLADIFDEEVSQAWRDSLWNLIEVTGRVGSVEWLLLTKRAENITSMFRQQWLDQPPAFIRMGVTGENQEMWDLRVSELMDVWHGKNFVSIEPMIGEVRLSRVNKPDWIICGCESGPHKRTMMAAWVQNLIIDSRQLGIPFFLKQMLIDGKLVKEPCFIGRQYLEFPSLSAECVDE